jgi:hypothetical protein
MIRSKNHVLIFIAVAISGSLLYFYFDPANSHVFPPCPFYTVTGLFCPGCGSQRAFHALLHGNITRSMHENLLFVLFLPLLLYSLVITFINVIRSDKIVQHVFYSSLFAKTVLTVVLLFWLFRNIPVEPFSWLAP